ncbi:MAG: 3-oxoacyl-[acyl-carrier-protein] reductase [Planctomycetota bacterium]|jgi:3-oxoacyl-[acyl-carrier protein] reductase
MRFQGLTALVTGGGGGIGAAVCTAFAREGARVVVNDVNRDAAEQVAGAIRDLGGEALTHSADITDPAQAKAMVDQTLKTFDRLDILVNNAGITRDTLVPRMSDEDWNRVLSVNLSGAFHCTRAVARAMMKQRSGSIVNVASIIGIGGNAGQANYAASKGGLIAFSRSLAKEMGPRGVRVNTLAPGFIQTPMTDVLPDKLKQGILERTPLNRFGTPEDVAQAVLFLAGPDAAFITGAVLRLDGGLAV